MSAVAKQWKTFRKRNLFTQVVLAQMLGISERQVHNIENGISKPRYSTQNKFNALRAKHERKSNGTDRGPTTQW